MTISVVVRYNSDVSISIDGAPLMSFQGCSHICCGISPYGSFYGRSNRPNLSPDVELHLIRELRSEWLDTLRGTLITFEFVDGEYDWFRDLLTEHLGFTVSHRWQNQNTGNDLTQVTRVMPYDPDEEDEDDDR